jgi:MFS family permease
MSTEKGIEKVTPVGGGEAPIPYNRTRIFVASCLALVTTSMFFAIRTDVLGAFGKEFNLSHEQQGWINLAGMWGFPAAIVFVGPLCDAIGMGRLLYLACFSHILGVALTILSPGVGFPMLLAATLLIGLANGTVEGVINPLTATIYSDQKTHKLNVLHAFWPGGLVIGGLLAVLISHLFNLSETSPAHILSLSWKVKYSLIMVSALAYGILLIGQKFPATERVQHGVSSEEMLSDVLRPAFIGLMLCMCLTAITELGPDQWVGSVLTDTVGLQGVIFLAYTSGFMFVLRFFAGPLVHKLSPFGLLTFSALLSAIGLFWLSHAFVPGIAFAAATVFAVGKTYFWPTTLGVTSEQFPRGGSLAMALMGAAGMVAAGLAGPVMGGIYDRGIIQTLQDKSPRLAQIVVENGKYSPDKADAIVKKAAAPDATAQDKQDAEVLKEAKAQGAAGSFRAVAVLPAIVFFVYGGVFLYFKSKGGYRPVQLAAGNS